MTWIDEMFEKVKRARRDPRRRPDWRWQIVKKEQWYYEYWWKTPPDRWVGELVKHRTGKIQCGGAYSLPFRIAELLATPSGGDHEGLTIGGIEIQARLLARQDHWQVARPYQVPEATIDAYAAFFFEVRDRRDDRDWIWHYAIHLGSPALLARPDAAALLRRLAYFRPDDLEECFSQLSHRGLGRLDPILGHNLTFDQWRECHQQARALLLDICRAKKLRGNPFVGRTRYPELYAGATPAAVVAAPAAVGS